MATYCTQADLLLPSEALAELQSSDIDKAIAAASAEADAYFAARYTLPLVLPTSGVWPPDLVNAVAQMATYRAMLMRGYAPQAGQNDSIQQGYKDAKAYLKDVSTGNATPQVKGSNSDAVTQEGGGPSSAKYVQQPGCGPSGTYSQDEDFWHDRDSANGGGGGFSGSKRRGY